MALFSYSGINNNGDETKGEVTATDQVSAIKKIQESGCMVTNIQEKKEKAKNKSFANKKVKKADLAIFSRQLSSMLSAGISITQALSSLSKQTGNPTLSDALANITSDIESGVNLTNAFSKYPKIFPPIYLSMINAGEVGGVLEESLLRLSIQLQKEKQISDNIKSATSYPKMIGGFAVIMFLAMVLFMVPIFEGFIPSDADIPSITQFTFNLSHSMRDMWYIWVLIIGIITFGIVYFFKSAIGKKTWENVKMKIPLFGPIIQKAVLARFARTLSTLLMGGIPVVQALESAGPTAGSTVLA
ncbi:MAG: type II secretion system F family protein, partial [Oscillospiraceae bacterium]